MPHSKHEPQISKDDQIGFIGYGNMGAPMLLNLSHFLTQHSLPPLIVHNRTLSRLPPASDSLVHASSAKQLAIKCDIVFTSLADDKAVQSVFEELLDGAREKTANGGKGVVFVETSTIYPTVSGELERQASKIPQTYYLQCPVFGPPPVAKKSQLVWVVSGDHFAKKRVLPYLVPSMGRKIIDVGSNVERASNFKLNGNFLVLGIMENLAEALTLSEKTGVGSDLLMEFVKEFLPAPSFIGYGTKMQTNAFEGVDRGFTVEGGLKDANHIRHLAASVNTTIPIIDLAHRNLITARAHGGGDLDWSSLIAGPRVATGLEPFTGLKKAPPLDTGFGAKAEDAEGVIEPVAVGGIKEVKNF
ncbi:NAD(P)-binding protein [Meredithblackwellia eburnea MCA 4105]